MNTSRATTGHSTAPSSPAARQPVFATTHWTVVLTAGRSETTHASAALERLCQTYWYPLYGYVRRRGHSPEDAQDLTQAFFARLLERQWIGRADREKGKFRCFLLSALKHFLADEWDRARAQKRGGGLTYSCPFCNLTPPKTRYGHEPADNTTPEQHYERRVGLWPCSRKSCAGWPANMNRMAARSFSPNSIPCLVGDRAALPYAELAAKLGTSESNMKSIAHRMRLRYRELLREEIAHTVASPTEVDDELRELFAILGGR